MDSLEELKQELELQKSAILDKGGVVQTAYTHPSPSEITAGINSIDSPNLSIATASEQDVVQGKTFYAKDSKLKTGTYVALDSTEFEEMYLYYNPESTNTYYFAVESGKTSIRPYLFGNTPHKMIITLNPELEEIGAYTFGEGDDLTISNFEIATNLKTVGEYGLSKAKNIDLSILPNSLEYIGEGGFRSTGENCDKVIIPSGITFFGNLSFSFDLGGKSYHNEFAFNNTNFTYFPMNLICNRIFDCDLIVPSHITAIRATFNFGGCFNNIVFHENVTSLSAGCFNAEITEPIEYFSRLKTITFYRTSPPQIGSSAFANQFVDTVKIYVPDESYDAYCRVSNLTLFKSNIYPMSQKE